MSGDLFWMVIGSDRGTARSVSSRDRSSRLPGSGCFCPFCADNKSELAVLLGGGCTRSRRRWSGIRFYLASYLRRSRPEAEAGRSVLLLLDTFDAGAEVKLHVEALLRGQVLQPMDTRLYNQFLR